ncbi:hypothetical protein [Chamaesiphon minutus]|uniref:Uncharacterized protein n=1 Tax=Chamaesiphon minutus (strain ATCC 27169 / PCC 6605) TaxID=1173020 RepID=K9UFR5_CHAP6|nr:hypothetical protein [Chamaesiphon minutus]AFY93498.1 hypothetical protein Cha6605_2441 [Chamaesiphon minutus PCC 6605]
MSKTPVLLVESSPAEIAKVRSNIDNEFQDLIKTINNYRELLEVITQEPPQLVILGMFDKFNYFEIGAELHKIQDSLQIVLLCKQEVVTDSFWQTLKNNNITAISVKEYARLNQILKTVERPIDLPSFTGETILVILQEIVAISNNHFGKLAQGNYWQKSRALIIDKYPSIRYFSVDHFGKIGCDRDLLERKLTDADIQGLRLWVQKFIEECERSKSNFSDILHTSNMSLPATYFLGELTCSQLP